MTMKQINESIDAEKIERGCRYIFSYMDREGFTIAEMSRLIVSMSDIKKRMLSISPLKRVSEFNYSESIDNSLESSFCSCISENADS